MTGVDRPLVAAVALLLLALHAPLAGLLLPPRAAPPAELPFVERFEGARGPPPPHFRSLSGTWRLHEGKLLSAGAKNNPLWLERALPADVRISFTAMALWSQGDVKVELFGDGRDHASGYVLILGGWRNTVTVLARRDEHALDRLETTEVLATQGVAQRWVIEAKGPRLRFSIDGELVLELHDPSPLRGPGHDRFGFSGWESAVLFDDLEIEAL